MRLTIILFIAMLACAASATASGNLTLNVSHGSTLDYSQTFANAVVNGIWFFEFNFTPAAGTDYNFSYAVNGVWYVFSDTNSTLHPFGAYAVAGNSTAANLTGYAQYQFGNNSFSGTGNFNTTGNISGNTANFTGNVNANNSINSITVSDNMLYRTYSNTTHRYDIYHTYDQLVLHIYQEGTGDPTVVIKQNFYNNPVEETYMDPTRIDVGTYRIDFLDYMGNGRLTNTPTIEFGTLQQDAGAGSNPVAVYVQSMNESRITFILLDSQGQLVDTSGYDYGFALWVPLTIVDYG